MSASSVRTLLDVQTKGYWSERFKMSVHGLMIIGGRWTPYSQIPWC